MPFFESSFAADGLEAWGGGFSSGSTGKGAYSPKLGYTCVKTWKKCSFHDWSHLEAEI